MKALRGWPGTAAVIAVALCFEFLYLLPLCIELRSARFTRFFDPPAPSRQWINGTQMMDTNDRHSRRLNDEAWLGRGGRLR